MKSAVIGSNPRIVNFYNAYIEMLGGIAESYNSINVGLKRAGIDRNITNIVIIIENREDFLLYSRLRDTIDEHSIHIFVVCTDDSFIQQATNQKVIVLSHKAVTLEFANILAGAGVCKPYLKENNGTRSPEKVFEHIKFMLARGNVTLPVEGDCAVRVLASLESDNITFKAIDEMTRLDPALHSGIIKMANSAYFGGSFSSITDVQKALVRVGLSNVKAFLVNFINKSIASNKNLLFKSEIGEAVRDSQIIASLCFVMADFFKVCSKTHLFSVGVLSKLGEIFTLAIISDYLSGEDSEDIQLNGYKQIAMQNNYFVGGTLMKKWKFPDEFLAPILFCQNMQENQFMNETRILGIAVSMTGYYKTGIVTEQFVTTVKKSGIALSEKQLIKIKEEAEKHYKEFTSVF